MKLFFGFDITENQANEVLDGEIFVTQRVPSGQEKRMEETQEELKALYSRQLGYYAYAVEKLFGKPVKKAYIRSFSLDETIEIPLH